MGTTVSAGPAAAADVDDECSDAPTKWQKKLCEQLTRWDKNAREAPEIREDIKLAPKDESGVPTDLAAQVSTNASSIFECMALGCMCVFIGKIDEDLGVTAMMSSPECTLKDGRKLEKAVRKEYRQLSDEEREKYHAALNAMKRSGEYDTLAAIHAVADKAGGAHAGPGFIGFHREYLKRIEVALRKVDPTVSLPYWDSTLEGHLPTPADSLIFTEKFAGEAEKAEGKIVNGPFKGWKTFEGRPSLRRWVGSPDPDDGVFGNVMDDKDIQRLINTPETDFIMGYAAASKKKCPEKAKNKFKVVESLHGGPHMYVGGRKTPDCEEDDCMGDMANIKASSNDPLFWMHHNFQDMVYELWRQKMADEDSREKIYPEDNEQCASKKHFKDAPMHPFNPWQNKDGVLNIFTANMYEFAPRPNCAMGPNCGSKYLFCDKSHDDSPRCAAKVREGGDCKGFTKGEDVCWEGKCENDKCVAVKKTVAPPAVAPPVPAILDLSKLVPADSGAKAPEGFLPGWTLRVVGTPKQTSHGRFDINLVNAAQGKGTGLLSDATKIWGTGKFQIPLHFDIRFNFGGPQSTICANFATNWGSSDYAKSFPWAYGKQFVVEMTPGANGKDVKITVDGNDFMTCKRGVALTKVDQVEIHGGVVLKSVELMKGKKEYGKK